MVAERVIVVAERVTMVASRFSVVASRLAEVASSVAVVAHGDLEMALNGGVIEAMVLTIEVAMVTPHGVVLILVMRCSMSCPREGGVVVVMMH